MVEGRMKIATFDKFIGSRDLVVDMCLKNSHPSLLDRRRLGFAGIVWIRLILLDGFLGVVIVVAEV